MSKNHHLRKFAVLGSLFLLIGRSSVADEPPAPPAAVDAGAVTGAAADLVLELEVPAPEVLEQGPIHEAFAEPLLLERQEPVVVQKQPPNPINELPPDERPDGRNVEWINGYWKYESKREDYVWVSGLWRDVPPRREWIAGQWQPINDGYTWSPGIWVEAGIAEVQTLPDPPETLEQGPSSPAPGDDYLWAPGCWRHENNLYAWQPGFWYRAEPDWVWVPNHYNYTSQGCVYVNGYWDYPLARRGLLYAPLFWRAGYHDWYSRAHYRPRHIINTGLLIASLYVHHHHGHYYYGFGRGGAPGWLYGWGLHGYHRWGHYGGGRIHGYDPLWAHYSWHNRQGRHGNHHRGGKDFKHGRGQGSGRHRPLVTTTDKLSRQHRDSMKMRRLDQRAVAYYQQRANKGRNITRVQSTDPMRGKAKSVLVDRSLNTTGKKLKAQKRNLEQRNRTRHNRSGDSNSVAKQTQSKQTQRKQTPRKQTQRKQTFARQRNTSNRPAPAARPNFSQSSDRSSRNQSVLRNQGKAAVQQRGNKRAQVTDPKRDKANSALMDRSINNTGKNLKAQNRNLEQRNRARHNRSDDSKSVAKQTQSKQTQSKQTQRKQTFARQRNTLNRPAPAARPSFSQSPDRFSRNQSISRNQSRAAVQQGGKVTQRSPSATNSRAAQPRFQQRALKPPNGGTAQFKVRQGSPQVQRFSQQPSPRSSKSSISQSTQRAYQRPSARQSSRNFSSRNGNSGRSSFSRQNGGGRSGGLSNGGGRGRGGSGTGGKGGKGSPGGRVR